MGLVYDQMFSTEAPPCEVFDCENASACKRECMACSAFQRYLLTGKAVAPTAPSKKVYEKLFPNTAARYYTKPFCPDHRSRVMVLHHDLDTTPFSHMVISDTPHKMLDLVLQKSFYKAKVA